ncbi:MAG: YxeA family protein [Oscillospiraceae bacterium]|jgi:uncharacterized protein (TIGR01655 family)|nr:YxeA family protein [Oscillospiraceae bacterium]
MKTSKKITLAVLGAVALALVAAVAIFGRQYYQNRYVSADYYAMVPLDYDITPQTMYAANGESMGPGKEYTLTIYSAEGESREVTFNVFAPESPMVGARALPKPGQYLLIKASKTIVTGWDLVDKSRIPEAALREIMGSR